MKYSVAGELEYTSYSDCTLILNIHVLKTPGQAILKESFFVDPDVRGEELGSPHGDNRFFRLKLDTPTAIKIKYEAVVDSTVRLIDYNPDSEVPVSALDPAILPYLYPSRYCQSDKLYRLAFNKFGAIENPYLQVLALTDWIHRNVEYLSGSTNSQTSAYDTITEQAGVCRDFAHLGIALCRALTIPARYFTGYAYKLEPADFHACFEAYLGGQWILFDATRLAPLNGMIKIATGRDAADTAIASIFGNVICQNTKVSVTCLEESFEPLFYGADDLRGISYF